MKVNDDWGHQAYTWRIHHKLSLYDLLTNPHHLKSHSSFVELIIYNFEEMANLLTNNYFESASMNQLNQSKLVLMICSWFVQTNMVPEIKSLTQCASPHKNIALESLEYSA